MILAAGSTAVGTAPGRDESCIDILSRRARRRATRIQGVDTGRLRAGLLVNARCGLDSLNTYKRLGCVQPRVKPREAVESEEWRVECEDLAATFMWRSALTNA